MGSVHRSVKLILTAIAPLLALGLGLAKPAAAAPQGGGGTIPVQVIAGRLVVSCDVSTAAQRLPVNLFLEVEGRHGLQLHNKAAAGLKAETASGQKRPITIHFPDFEVTVPGRELGDEDLFEEFTKYNSEEMGENALVGSIGVEILKDWTVTFDVGNGAVRLAPPTELQGAPPTSVRVEGDGTIVAPLTLIDEMAWLPVRWSDGKPGGMMLGSGVYDSRIDIRAARQRGKPAGDVGALKIGSVDFASFVAFRPEPVVQVHPDGVVGVTGINLLECLEITVNRSQRELRLRATKKPSFPSEDLEFFRARADEDPEALQAFLEKHGGRGDDKKEPVRLAHEAARLLLDYRLTDLAEEAQVQDSVQWIFDTMKGDLRTTRMLDLMKEMADAGENAVVIAAGKLGIEAGRDDRYPNAVHEVHGRLGRTLMDEGESDGAWRHLLSAAFGLPEDGRINYDLGRFYEQQKRYRRAYSRYVQSVIKPEAGGLAIEALQRVQPLMEEAGEGGEAFSVDTIERMIAGKVRSFGAASKFIATEEQPCNRIVLAEFFTNGHYGNETRGGAIGGALGFEGLITHFGPDEMAFLEYHLPKPQPDSLCTSLAEARAAQLGVADPNVIVLDGQVGSPGAGKWRDAEAIYTRARRAALERMSEFGDYEVEVEALIEDGKITGSASAFGPAEGGMRLQVVLAEKGVLYPGGSGVIVHRYVARASLLKSDEGIPFDLDEQEDAFFEHTFAEVETDLVAHLEGLEARGIGTAPRISTKMDPNQARVIAILYDGSTGAVLAASSCIPVGVESEDAEVAVPAAKRKDK